ncbi:hypothetical protein AAZX31_20G177600 [Glycine max]
MSQVSHLFRTLQPSKHRLNCQGKLVDCPQLGSKIKNQCLKTCSRMKCWWKSSTPLQFYHEHSVLGTTLRCCCS